jgi:hypothetical protein
MADLEKQEQQQQQPSNDPVSPAGTDDTLISPADSEADLEKAETLSRVPTSLTSGTARSRRSIAKTRSVATDGYSAYNLVDEAEAEEDEVEDGTALATPRRTRTKTDPFEVRWDGPNDKTCPRNFKLVRKWFIVFITSFSSFCVYVPPRTTWPGDCD